MLLDIEIRGVKQNITDAVGYISGELCVGKSHSHKHIKYQMRKLVCNDKPVIADHPMLYVGYNQGHWTEWEDIPIEK